MSTKNQNQNIYLLELNIFYILQIENFFLLYLQITYKLHEKFAVVYDIFLSRYFQLYF